MRVELSFHAKALEVYTMAYQSIQSVDEEEDLEVGFRLKNVRTNWHYWQMKFYLQPLLCS